MTSFEGRLKMQIPNHPVASAAERRAREAEQEVLRRDTLEKFSNQPERLRRENPKEYFRLRKRLVGFNLLAPLTPEEEQRSKEEIRAHASANRMDVYENVVVGNFLFGLGVKMGLQRNSGTSPTLLQQTPIDEQLGDVLLKSRAIVRLIEFKRQKAPAKVKRKEANKLSRLARCLNKHPRSETLQAVSRRIHWYIESKIEKAELKDSQDPAPNRFVLSSCIVPYLDFQLRTSDFTEEALPRFIDFLAGEPSSPAVSDQEMQNYRCGFRKF
jgi:hypothetical protein